MATLRNSPTVLRDAVTTRQLPSYISLPNNWYSGAWFTQKALAQAGQGIASLAAIGDSITGGANTSNADGLAYGWMGRLKALLVPSLGAAWEAWPFATYQSGQIPTSTCPFTWTGTAFPTYDCGMANGNAMPDAATWEVTIAANAHPITGVYPTSVELLYVDRSSAAGTFQYQIDSNTAVSAPALSGGGSTYANSILCRLSIPLDGLSNHTVKIGQLTNAYAIIACTMVIHYNASSGLGLGRNGFGGFKAVDFAEGAGATAGGSTTFANLQSYGPDHIQPWTGQTTANNTAGAGAPFAPHLGIISLGTNDFGYGTHPLAFEKAICRMVEAFQAGQPAPSPGNVLIVAPQASMIYGSGNNNYKVYRYKGILRNIADRYGCAFIDLETLFGHNSVANGWMTSGNVHPTANGSGTGGGDGHLLIAQTIASIL